MVKPNNPTRNQHTIPEVYLKEFTFDSNKKKIYYFDKRWVHNKAVKDTSISSLFNRDIFTRLESPTADTAIEDRILKTVDDLYGKSLPNIKRNIRDLIIPNEQDLVNLILFLSYLPVRTTYFAERASKLSSELPKIKDALLKSASDFFMKEFNDHLSKFTIQDKLNFQSNAYINLLQESKLSHYPLNIMIRHADMWREEIFRRTLFFVSLSEGMLITSDNPFYTRWSVKAPDFGDKPIPIVLTPEMGLILGKHKPSQDNLPINIVQIDSKHLAYADFNNMVLENSHFRTYSNDKNVLETWLMKHNLL